MATASELQIILKAKDEASKVMGDVTKNADALGKTFKTIAVGGAAVVGVMAGIGTAAIKLAVDALPLENISKAFAGISGNADETLAKLRAGALGMATDKDLMIAYNSAAQLVSKTFADQLPDAMGYLSKVSAATGQDMGYMIDSLVKGVGRMSPMILDNLGIQVSLAEAVDRAAQMFGKEADELTKAEQQAGMMSVIMEKLQANTAAMPEVAGTAAQSWGAFKVELQNLTDQIGDSVIPAFQALIQPVMQLAREYGPQLATFIKDSLVPAIIKGAEVFGQIVSVMANDVIPVIGQVVGWVKDNLIVIMAGLAVVLVTTVVPAFITWAAAAGAAAVATITALAPVVLPILAIMAAVALLKKAWDSDWLGIRTKLTEAWNQSIRPALEDLWKWLSVTMPAAVVEFKDSVVAGWNNIMDFFRELPAKFVQFGKDIFAGLWQGMQDVWNSVMGWIQEKIDKLPKVIRDILQARSPSQVMVDIGKDFIEGFLVGMDEKKLEMYRDVVDIFNGIVRAVSAWPEAIAGLLDMKGINLASLQAKAHEMAAGIKAIIVELMHAAWAFTDQSGDWRNIPKATAEFAGWVSTILGAVKTAVDGLTALREYKTGALGYVDNLITNLKGLLLRLGLAFADYDTSALAGFVKSLEHIAPIMSAIGGIAKGLEAMREYKSGAMGYVDNFLTNLDGILQRVANFFGLYGPKWLINLEQIFPRMATIFGSFKTIVDAMDSMRQYKSGAMGYVDNFLTNLKGILTRVANFFGKYGESWLVNLAQIFPRMAEVFGSFKTIVDAMAAMRTYKSGAMGYVDNFLTNLRGILTRIANFFGAYGKNWLINIAQLFPRFATIFGGFKSLIDGFAAIATYGGVKMARVDLFIADLKETLIKVANAFRDFGEYWLVHVAKIFERGGTIFQSMDNALGMFKALEDFTGGKYISPAKIDTLISMMKYVMEAFVWLGYYVGPIVKEASRIFAEDVKSMFDAMKSALDFFAKLADEALPAKDKVDAFLKLMKDMLASFTEAESVAEAAANRNFGTAVASARAFEYALIAARNFAGAAAAGGMSGIGGGPRTFPGGMSGIDGIGPWTMPNVPAGPQYPTSPGWPGFDAPPSYGGGGGGGGIGDKAEFYLHNIANDIHDLLYIEKVKAEREGNAGLAAEINRLLGAEAFIWTRT